MSFRLYVYQDFFRVNLKNLSCLFVNVGGVFTKKKEDNTLWCFMLRFESPEIQNHFC